MAGITNPPFRKLCMEMGAAFTVTELVSSHALVYLTRNPRPKKPTGVSEKTKTLLSRYEREDPFAVQIFGREPDMMVEAAKYVEGNGADIIDLNFGCPARKVVRAGEGAGVALMREPTRLKSIAEQVVQAVSVPVTAKIRAGWSPSERNAPLIAEILEDVGIAAICVHARTRDQVHSGPIDLETLAAVCDTVSIPVIGNGGIRNQQDALDMIEKTGCHRVAVGQAAKGNPWIFSEIKNGQQSPELKDRIETCKRHLTLYVDWLGDRRAAMEMRKHACWYIKGFAGAAAFRKQLAYADSADAFRTLLDGIATGVDL